VTNDAVTENAHTYIALAERCVRGGQLTRAADHYEVALRFDQGSMLALCGLARVHIRSGSVEDARRVLARARAIDDEAPEVLKLQAEMHGQSGRYDLVVRNIYMASEAALDRRYDRR